MLLTGGILIFNSIRLTIVARRKEMLIMQLVGAARSTIRVPLLIEGMIQGTLGGVVASLLLWPAYEVVQSLGKTLAFLSESAAAYPAMGVFFSLSGIGAVYGLICSAIAVREPRMAR
jgi:cell division transport system permease protein